MAEAICSGVAISFLPSKINIKYKELIINNMWFHFAVRVTKQQQCKLLNANTESIVEWE